MNTKDINLYESGNGGEMSIVANDLLISETLFQQVYLALFGGNVEAVTRGDEVIGQERFDYWANSLFFADNPTRQCNSETEKFITNMPFTTSNRLKLIEYVKSDLSYLSFLINYSVDVAFESSNRVVIIVNFTEKGSQEDKLLQLVYDNAKNEVIINKMI